LGSRTCFSKESWDFLNGEKITLHNDKDPFSLCSSPNIATKTTTHFIAQYHSASSLTLLQMGKIKIPTFKGDTDYVTQLILNVS
jgi:hypothetical protein